MPPRPRMPHAPTAVMPMPRSSAIFASADSSTMPNAGGREAPSGRAGHPVPTSTRSSRLAELKAALLPNEQPSQQPLLACHCRCFLTSEPQLCHRRSLRIISSWSGARQRLAADLVGWSPQLGDMLDAGNGEGLFALAVARQGSVNLGIDDNALCDTVTLLLALSQLLRDVGLPTALA